MTSHARRYVLRRKSRSGEPGRGVAASCPVANEAGLRALGQSIEASRRRPSRRRRRLRRTLVVLGLVVVLIAAGAGGYAWYLNHLVHRITVKGLAAGETHGTESGTENILLVGSTDRCALKKQYIGYGICSQGVNGINSDVVMILHLNPTTHSVSILSIPRDLFVPNARIEGANKIDAALYQGPTQLVAAIQEDFAIPDPALRRTQLRQLRQRGGRVGRNQHVLPRAGLRRRVGPGRDHSGLPSPQRLSCPPGGEGAAHGAQGSRGDIEQPCELDSGSAKRPGPHPARPRVPAGAGHGSRQEGVEQPTHRSFDHHRGGSRSHSGQRIRRRTHDQPGADLPLGQRR